MRENFNRKNFDKYQGIVYNTKIKYSEIRINGNVISTKQALSMAIEQGVDLILVAEKANPPVCKLMDINKYVYDLKQKEKETKRKQRENIIEQKEIRMSLNIDTGDINVKVNNARNVGKEM